MVCNISIVCLFGAVFEELLNPIVVRRTMTETMDEDTDIDLSNACRLCLVSEEGAAMLEIDQLVLKYCGISLSDNPSLPNQICGNCQAVLHFIKKFKKMCENSDIYLRDYCSKGTHTRTLNVELIQPLGQQKEIVVPDNYDKLESSQVQDYYQDVQAEEVARDETIDEESGEYLYEIESNGNYEDHQGGKEEVDGCSENDNDSAGEMWIEEGCPLDEGTSEGSLFIVDDSNSVDVGDTVVRSMNVELATKVNRKAVKGSKKGKSSLEFCHVCEICGNSYKRLGALETHRRRHLNHRPFDCELCGATFTFNFMLERHMRKHTGDRPFTCEYCDRKFVDRSTMSRHQKIHRNERAYKCDLCGKSFTYFSVLKTHLMSHTGEKPYSCGICEKSFHRTSDLKNHLETLQHRKDPRAAMLIMAIKRKN